MNPPRTVCFSVDIDGLDLYYRIHGLEVPGDTPSLYATGVRRFLDLFASARVRATFFAVGADLDDEDNAHVLWSAAAAGHEVASHTHSHPYDLPHLDAAAQRREVVQAEEAIERATGRRPVGFRAPGYNISPSVLTVLAQRGYAYDSSILPSPPYLLARAAILGAYRLAGRTSHSIVGDLRHGFRSLQPHHVSLPGGQRLLEIPMTAVPLVRIPVIGTSLIAGGVLGWVAMRQALARLPFVHIEFHAIDLTDHHADGIDDALLRQPDQRVPLDRKLALFERVLGDLCADRDALTLAQLAASLT